MRNKFQIEMIKLPKNVAGMKMSDFVNSKSQTNVQKQDTFVKLGSSNG